MHFAFIANSLTDFKFYYNTALAVEGMVAVTEVATVVTVTVTAVAVKIVAVGGRKYRGDLSMMTMMKGRVRMMVR